MIFEHRIRRREIKTFLTDDFYSSLLFWQRIKKYGLPYGSGWANLPFKCIELLELFDMTLSRLQEEERNHGNNR